MLHLPLSLDDSPPSRRPPPPRPARHPAAPTTCSHTRPLSSSRMAYVPRSRLARLPTHGPRRHDGRLRTNGRSTPPGSPVTSPPTWSSPSPAGRRPRRARATPKYRPGQVTFTPVAALAGAAARCSTPARLTPCPSTPAWSGGWPPALRPVRTSAPARSCGSTVTIRGEPRKVARTGTMPPELLRRSAEGSPHAPASIRVCGSPQCLLIHLRRFRPDGSRGSRLVANGNFTGRRQGLALTSSGENLSASRRRIDKDDRFEGAASFKMTQPDARPGGIWPRR